MAIVTMRELLEAGVHFGHQNKRWNPKMKHFIYTSRNGIHVIDLHKSIPHIERAFSFVREIVGKGGSVLFVGTKKQAQDSIREEATRCGMFYVSDRWLGGTLTNFRVVSKSIARLKEIEKMENEGGLERLSKNDIAGLKREKARLERGVGGLRNMVQTPTILFIVDSKKEHTAIAEAKRAGIPVVSLVDTNCDPEEVDYPIPANDDAIRSVRLLTKLIAEAVLQGRAVAQPSVAGVEAPPEGPVVDIAEQSELIEQLSKEEQLAEALRYDPDLDTAEEEKTF